MQSEQVIVAQTAIPLLPAGWGEFPGLVELHLHVQGAAIRLLTDGRKPTATDGLHLPVGSVVSIPGVSARAALAISASDTAAVVTVSTAPSVTGLEAGAYTTGTFTATATGFDAVITGTAGYVQVGQHVTLSLPTLEGTSNASGFTITGLPAVITPAATEFAVVLADNSGTADRRILRLNANSTTIDLFSSSALGTWATSLGKKLYATTLTYRSI